MSLRVLIVDDEPPARERLRSMLAETGEFEVAGEAGNGEQAHRPGRQADARHRAARRAHARHRRARSGAPSGGAARAAGGDLHHRVRRIRAAGVRVRGRRLSAEADPRREAARRARQGRAPHRARSCSRWPLPRASRRTARTSACAAATASSSFPIEEVFCFQADQKYTTVKHQKGEDLIEDSLKTLEEEFAASFVRIHRNALVNTQIPGAHRARCQRPAFRAPARLAGRARSQPAHGGRSQGSLPDLTRESARPVERPGDAQARARHRARRPATRATRCRRRTHSSSSIPAPVPMTARRSASPA